TVNFPDALQRLFLELRLDPEHADDGVDEPCLETRIMEPVKDMRFAAAPPPGDVGEQVGMDIYYFHFQRLLFKFFTEMVWRKLNKWKLYQHDYIILFGL